MTIYNYIELLFIAFFIIEVSGKQSESKRLRFYYLETFIVVFILAFRNFNVGADSILYTDYYRDPGTYLYQMPWGFEAFCNFLKIFSGDWRFFIFVTSILAVIPFCYFVRTSSRIVSFSFLTFLLCWKQLWLLETPIKQTTAMAFFFMAYLILIKTNNEHKWTKRLLALGLIVFSVLTHSTIIMVIMVLALLHFIHFTRKQALICIIASIVVSSSMIAFIPGLYDKLEMYTMGYQLFDNVQNYTEDIASGLITYDFKFTLLPSLFVMMVLLMCSEKQMQSLQAKCLVAGTVIFNLFVAFPNIPRVVLFYTLIGSALCPENYKGILRGHNPQKLFAIVHLLLLWAFYYVHLKLCMEFKPTMDADFLPYSFWF